MRGLKDKVVIVTGGGGGIGTATCRRFAEEGAKVAVLDIDEPAAARVATAITDAGGTAAAYPCDITRPLRLRRCRARSRSRARPARRAGQQCRLGCFPPLRRDDAVGLGQDHRHQSRRRAQHASCRPARHGARKRGRVVNVASDAARVGSSGEAVYAACKAGLIGFSKTLAREHARDGITVNVVCPGIVNTKLYADYKKGARNPEKLDEAFRRAIPLGRLGEPDDLPGAICFLASDDAAFITGQVLSVSGGLTMAG